MTDGDGNLKDLIARLEKAEGADRELDARLFAALEAPNTDHCWFTAVAESYAGATHWNVKSSGGGTYRYDIAIPAYTKSIDAALALVERKLPGWEWTLWFGGCAVLVPHAQSFQESNKIEARAETPALALCLALLRAMDAPNT